MLKMLQVLALLESEVLAFSLHWLLANLHEDHVLEADALRAGCKSVHIDSCDLAIHHLEVLDLPKLQEMKALSHILMRHLVKCEVYVFACSASRGPEQHVAEGLEMSFGHWKLVLQVYMHLVCELCHLVVRLLRPHEFGILSHLVAHVPLRGHSLQVLLALQKLSEALAEPAEGQHEKLKVEETKDLQQERMVLLSKQAVHRQFS